jgi:transposase
MAYRSDLTDEQWKLLEPEFNAAGKRGRKHADDLRRVVDAMLHIAQTGRQYRPVDLMPPDCPHQDPAGPLPRHRQPLSIEM